MQARNIHVFPCTVSTYDANTKQAIHIDVLIPPKLDTNADYSYYVDTILCPLCKHTI